MGVRSRERSSSTKLRDVTTSLEHLRLRQPRRRDTLRAPGLAEDYSDSIAMTPPSAARTSMVTAGVRRLFVDTNISVFATDAGSPLQSAAETDTSSPVNSATTSAGRRLPAWRLVCGNGRTTTSPAKGLPTRHPPQVCSNPWRAQIRSTAGH